MKMGEIAAARVQFQEAHDIAACLTEAEPENEKYLVMLPRGRPNRPDASPD